MDQALIESTTLPGVLPGRQRRSREVVAKLLSSALTLLADRDFAALSIADVCAEAGVTAGAFYKRFDSKDHFIEFLQRLVVEEVRLNMAASFSSEQLEQLERLNLHVFLQKSVEATARWYRQYEGFARASLRYAQQRPESWSPLRETGERYTRAMEPLILQIVGKPGDEAVRDAVRFGVQFMLGTFNSMVLIDPGPYRLGEARTVSMLAEAMTLLIENSTSPAGKR